MNKEKRSIARLFSSSYTTEQMQKIEEIINNFALFQKIEQFKILDVLKEVANNEFEDEKEVKEWLDNKGFLLLNI